MRQLNRIAAASLVSVALTLAARAETPVAVAPSPASGASAPATAVPAASVPAASAQTTVERIKARGSVKCGTAFRPGIASSDPKGHWAGLNFEICRAVAIAVLGKTAHFVIHQYDSDRDYDAVRNGEDDVAFLTHAEMVDHKLLGAVLPGLPVFTETHDVLVTKDSPVQHVSELGGSTMCFMMATEANGTIDAWSDENKINLIRYAFRETDEMYDTYVVQRCKAVLAESTELAEQRLRGGVNHITSRILPEHLASFPILATTPLKSDAQWAAVVDWTIRTLMAADAHETYHRPDGVRALEIDGTTFGLAKDWQKIVVANAGSYKQMFDRNLGAGSPLKLDPGLNAPQPDGRILLSYPPVKTAGE